MKFFFFEKNSENFFGKILKIFFKKNYENFMKIFSSFIFENKRKNFRGKLGKILKFSSEKFLPKISKITLLTFHKKIF